MFGPVLWSLIEPHKAYL